jgi:hypothetical protein
VAINFKAGSNRTAKKKRNGVINNPQGINLQMLSLQTAVGFAISQLPGGSTCAVV